MGLYPIMQQGLHSPIPEIQILALDQAQKMTELDDPMLSSLVSCLGAEDASVGKKAVEVITKVSLCSLLNLIPVILLSNSSDSISASCTHSPYIARNPSIPRPSGLLNQSRCPIIPKAITAAHVHAEQHPKHGRPNENERNSILRKSSRSLP